MYLVVREGHYWQGVVGVFSSWSLAKEAAEKAAGLERDRYHKFGVYWTGINQQLALDAEYDKTAVDRLVPVGCLDRTSEGDFWHLGDEDPERWTSNMDSKESLWLYALMSGDPVAVDGLKDILKV